MQDELKARLMELGLTEDQVNALEEKGGVKVMGDMALVKPEDLINWAGMLPVPARRIALAFEPAPSPAATPAAATSTGTEEVGEGGPTPTQVSNFAANLGVDPSMMMMFLMSGSLGAATGSDIDISGMMPVEQILGSYNPKRRDLPYMFMGQVQRRLGDRPIIVINDNGGINTALTLQYIRELEDGGDPVEDDILYDSDGKPYQLIRVGVDAQSIYDADPLKPGKSLGLSEMGHGRISWSHVSLDVRQLVYLAVTETNELQADDEAKVGQLRGLIVPGVARLALGREFPRAAALYSEKLRMGSLPTLKVQRTTSGARRKEVMPRRRPGSPRDLSGYSRGEEASRPGDGFPGDES